MAASRVREKKSCLLKIAEFVLITTYILTFYGSCCQPYELNPSKMLTQVQKTCLVVFFSQNSSDKNSEIISDLHDIFQKGNHEKEVKAGIVYGDVDDLIWPNGQSVHWVDKESRMSFASTDKNGVLTLFPKYKKDRTCLSVASMSENPKAVLFTGFLNIKTVLEWVNDKCNTFISLNGGLTYGGLHRESIQQNLFHVSKISNFTMLHFDRHRRNLVSSPRLENISKNTGENFCRRPKCESIIFSGQCHQSMEGCYCDIGQSDRPNADLFVNDKTVSVKSCDVKDDTCCTESVYNNKQDTHQFYIDEKKIPQCERLTTIPTKGEFFNKFLKASKPFIIEGATAHWDALHKWTMDFLRERYGNNEVHIKLAPDGLFEGVDDVTHWEEHGTFEIPKNIFEKLPFPDLVVVRPASINVKFSEFLDMIGNHSNTSTSEKHKPRASAYLEYSSIPNYLPELEQDVEEFPFVQGLLKRRHLNIWLSDGNTLGKLHFDPFDNFLCQIRGRKQLILFEPHDNTKMYEGHIPEAMLGYDRHSGKFRRKKLLESTAMVMAPADILNPDFERFPAFAKTHPLNCTINEGDVLFMPAFWWHEVQSYPNVTERRNLAVNFWYEPFLTKEFPCAHCKLDVNPLYRHLL
ncbi:uncharacterized protein [Asterias amurensis]|uniref:uncharacterized protein n=1 Tax=Asterias amurensis TaxID=7602 RepID=UPI003AB34724